MNKKNIYTGTFKSYSPLQKTDMDLLTYLKSNESKWPYEERDSEDFD